MLSGFGFIFIIQITEHLSPSCLSDKLDQSYFTAEHHTSKSSFAFYSQRYTPSRWNIFLSPPPSHLRANGEPSDRPARATLLFAPPLKCVRVVDPSEGLSDVYVKHEEMRRESTQFIINPMQSKAVRIVDLKLNWDGGISHIPTLVELHCLHKWFRPFENRGWSRVAHKVNYMLKVFQRKATIRPIYDCVSKGELEFRGSFWDNFRTDQMHVTDGNRSLFSQYI